MRFMMIVKANKDSEAGVMPSEEKIATMGKFNEELLKAGINVWTTLNVQHLESLVDVVWKITGVRQRETVPDLALSRADEIELIDITPAELRERMAEGKVYLADTARLAADRFFKVENLTALRELEAGITYVNSSTIGAEVHLPFGGMKHTGNGHREGSQTVLDVFTEWKTLYIDYSGRLQKAQIDVG